MAHLIIKHEGLETPEDDGGAFDTLAKANAITQELASRLKRAKGMRNIVAHQYGGVNDEMVFRALKTELVKDAKEFSKQCHSFANHP